MSRKPSTDPMRRLGVYKRHDDIPDSHRLSTFAGEYISRDAWAEWLDDRGVLKRRGEGFAVAVERAERDWKGHMDGRDRHHAIATPADVEAWCSSLLERNTPDSAYKNYWVHVHGFYHWLLTHADHRHVYNPALMAAAEYPGGAAETVFRETFAPRGGGTAEVSP